MNMELSQEELTLIRMLLVREEAETRIEIHHARRSFEYRDHLKAREKEIHELLERIHKVSPEEIPSISA